MCVRACVCVRVYMHCIYAVSRYSQLDDFGGPNQSGVIL